MGMFGGLGSFVQTKQTSAGYGAKHDGIGDEISSAACVSARLQQPQECLCVFYCNENPVYVCIIRAQC